MWHTEGFDTIYTNMNLWSIALFLDTPLNTEKGTAISAYAGYFNYDFGPGYIRYNGIMNPANGTTIPLPGITNTFGNAFPMFGTGNAVYSHLGYLLPKNLLAKEPELYSLMLHLCMLITKDWLLLLLYITLVSTGF
jgi:hypothetical protein